VFLLSIPDGEGEHPVKVTWAIEAPFFITVDDDLGVRARFENMPPSLELFAKFDEVIDFAIKDDLQAAVFVRDRLVAALKINDAEAPMPQAYVLRHIVPFSIRPTMAKRIAHPTDKIRLDWSSLKIECSTDAAHWILAWVLFFRFSGEITW
jgi:hypothetical protein